jgi:hypothetical protein
MRVTLFPLLDLFPMGGGGVLPRINQINKMSSMREWKWKPWDVRSDGKIFWRYGKRYKNGEYWITWDQAINEKKQKNDYFIKNKEKLNEYRRNLKRKHKESDPAKYSESVAIYSRRYRAKNQQKISEYNKKYKLNNRHKIREYEKTKREKDLLFQISSRVRNRVLQVIKNKGYSKKCKTGEMLGCSWEHLKYHLESKFKNGMTWENRSKWHIDHIVPISSAKSEEEISILCHYTNLQPLWAEDNLRKGNKMLSQV